MGRPVVLVVHGSQDPRAAAATGSLVREMGNLRPGVDVRASYLDHTSPHPAELLRQLHDDGHRAVTVVPLLLTAAFHTQVDIPRVLARVRADGVRLDISVADVLGPVDGVADPRLLAGLRRRLAEVSQRYDALVLAAAGTRDAAARETVEVAAAALGAELEVECAVAYASAAPPTGAEAVQRLRSRGARRVLVVGYFLAPGQLYDTVTGSALSAGAVAAAAPLGGATEVAELVFARADAARPAN